jgi:hypothetical protein
MLHAVDDSGEYKKVVRTVGIKETLQEALVNANNERHACHAKLQDCDSRLVQAKVNLEKARTLKLGAEEINENAVKAHQELVKYSGTLQEPSARDAIHPEINRLGVEQSFALREAISAGKAYDQQQSLFAELEKERSAAHARLLETTERWNEINKQIANLNQS